MKKNGHTSKKFVYIECIKLCTYFETLNIKYTKFCTFFEGLYIECTYLTLSVIYDEKCPHIKRLWYLNIQNCVCYLKNCWRKMSTHKKICVYWTQNCVHSFENCIIFESMDIECTNLILSLICDEKCPRIKKIVCFEYTKLCMFFENLCTLNI